MLPEENDPAWKLLGQLRDTEEDPFFSRNVLREVRQLKQEPAGLAAKLGISGFLDRIFSPSLALPLSAAAALALGLFLLREAPSEEANPTLAATDATPVAAVIEPAAREIVETAEIVETGAVAAAGDDLIALEEEIDEFAAIDELGELAAMQDVAMLSDEDISRLLF